MRLFGWMRGMGFVFGAMMMAAGPGARAQTPPLPPAQQPAGCQLVKDAHGNLTLDPNCPTTGAPASSVPGTPSAPAAQRFPYPGENTAPNAPNAPGTQNAVPPGSNPVPAADTGAPASKRFPYPGEVPASTPGAPPESQTGKPVPGQPPLQDAGSSGESSSSTSSSSSSANPAGSQGSQAANPESTDPDDPAADPAKIAAARKARRKKAEPPPPTPSEREQEDVQIAGFYQNDGNFKGAYERAKDAVTLDKDDPAAHLALGESARKLGKLDEALQEYKQCLALDPVPKVRKVAEKALKEMTGGGS